MILIVQKQDFDDFRNSQKGLDSFLAYLMSKNVFSRKGRVIDPHFSMEFGPPNIPKCCSQRDLQLFF